MRYRLFGRTGLRVSEFVLGTMTFEDPEQTRKTIEAFADAGGNFLDTASAYGESESLLGAAIQERDRFVIGTKYTLSRDAADPNGAGNHRKNLRLSLERSLRRLRTDYVDVYWVHIWDRHTPLEETMRALDDAVRAGKILYVGISDAPAWVVSRANTLAEWRDWTPFAGLQVPYNLVRRDVERELLPMAEALGLSVTAWGPLAAGLLSGGASRRVDPAKLSPRERAAADAVRSAAAELGATPSQVALAWIRQKSPVVLPLVGARNAEQIAENVVSVVLPDEVMRRLDSAVEFERGFPADFIAECETSPFVFGAVAGKL
ncbi:aldo/keto reductase [Allokutzneria sp. A3M-2-11 16]|uniref:aldo/keto reductase n=1 Tax=Allokutzneria sp. A3M-2-11 16 TaxID=2962043 RepID=UPI0020B7EA8D|nr:aldo/keto reductase [Allokutzneria sp. A3M-2-11 16]MCP3804183.1 aldo/keto reductase [Allokutzneria sp. A3M-2-11 16]